MMANAGNSTSTLQGKEPWLSIVIPIYNAEKFLKQCLDSIQRQTFDDFEVLLVDDGSPDHSAEICRLYVEKDSRFHYIRKENGGAYQTRIFGAELTKGTYVTFCDADDYYSTKDAFQILHNYLSSGAYDVVQFGFEMKYNHLKQKKPCVRTPFSVDRKGFIANEYPRLLCSYWDNATITTNACNKVYHRKLLSQFPASGAAEKIFWGDDLIMNLHLTSACNSMLFIPETLYSYRQCTGGTSRFSARAMEDLDHIKQYQLFYLERYEGEAAPQIRSTLFSEVACWFMSHVGQALKYMSEPEVENLILEALKLPQFVATRNYYLQESDCNWEAMELLRKADPQAYIARGKTLHNELTVKDHLRQFIRKVYAWI